MGQLEMDLSKQHPCKTEYFLLLSLSLLPINKQFWNTPRTTVKYFVGIFHSHESLCFSPCRCLILRTLRAIMTVLWTTSCLDIQQTTTLDLDHNYSADQVKAWFCLLCVDHDTVYEQKLQYRPIPIKARNRSPRFHSFWNKEGGSDSVKRAKTDFQSERKSPTFVFQFAELELSISSIVGATAVLNLAKPDLAKIGRPQRQNSRPRFNIGFRKFTQWAQLRNRTLSVCVQLRMMLKGRAQVTNNRAPILPKRRSNVVRSSRRLLRLKAWFQSRLFHSASSFHPVNTLPNHCIFIDIRCLKSRRISTARPSRKSKVSSLDTRFYLL